MIFSRSQKSAMFALLVASTALVPMKALADNVTLKSPDGTINLTGELLSVENDYYLVRTSLGDMRIAQSRVECEGASCPRAEPVSANVRIAGSDTVGLGMMPLLMSGYASHLNAEAFVEETGRSGEVVANFVGENGFGDDMGSYLVTSTTSGDAFKTLLAGSAHIGMASRRIKPTEARELRDAGIGNMVSPSREHILAVDSLIVVTHPNNPVDSLSLSQLADIYSGKITNWSEVGGRNETITMISRQESSGTRSVFESRIFPDDDGSLVASAKIAADNNEMADMVAADESALGFVGYAYKRGAKALSLVNECGISTTPDAFSAKTEEYSLQRRLYLYSRADQENEAASDFLEFALSSAADGVIAKSGFIDLGVDRRAQSKDSPRGRMLQQQATDSYEGSVARDMLTVMSDYDRLSTTFRFRSGSAKLDERAAVDMSRLAEFLESQSDGTRVVFVGFTDSVGAFDSNRDLSRGRAQQAMLAMQAYAGDRLANIEWAYAGFGEIAPSACNSSNEGRAINRRVEVWLETTRS